MDTTALSVLAIAVGYLGKVAWEMAGKKRNGEEQARVPRILERIAATGEAQQKLLERMEARLEVNGNLLERIDERGDRFESGKASAPGIVEAVTAKLKR